MLKLHYIDRIETKLHKAEIEEKLREIVLEDHFFNIFTAGLEVKSEKKCGQLWLY